jgi:hypothetical protein
MLTRLTAFVILILTCAPVRAEGIDEILSRMIARNDWQDKALLAFQANRKFYAANARFRMDSTMYVHTVFRQPDKLESTVMSHEGSKLIRSRVFDKILEAEEETRSKKDKQQVDIIPANYNFALLAVEACDTGPCYHLSISPRHPDKYSITGEIWVDGKDYTIVRIHGSPAKRPSIWTIKTEIDRRYKKIDGIWLPDRMDSSSNLRIAGHAVLSIEYTYESVEKTP